MAKPPLPVVPPPPTVDVHDGGGNITGDPAQVARAVSHLAEIANAQALGIVIKE